LIDQRKSEHLNIKWADLVTQSFPKRKHLNR
jgi:hypothetical protein